MRRNLTTVRSAAIVTTVLALGVLAGCGGGGGSNNNATTTTTTTSTSSSPGGSSAACSPSGTSLTISAKNIKFSKNCLAAPAGKAFTISFDNEDSGVPHNIDIYTNSSATKSLFKGAIVTGPKTVTYNVPALSAGTYYFRCDIHPTQMSGTFVVQ